MDTEQFVEILCKIMNDTDERVPEFEPETTLRCDNCGSQLIVFDHIDGVDEYCRCLECGCTKAYRVR